MFLRLSATPGSEQTLPREAPARRGGHRRPFFRYRVRGLLCGKCVEPPRGRGRPSGARESQLFWGYIINKTIFKDPFGHHYYYYHYRGALYNKDIEATFPSGYLLQAPSRFGDKLLWN